MADKTSMATYNKTGFAASSGVTELKGQLPNFPTGDAAVRQQAEAQYADTYVAEQDSLKTQLSALITAQNNDSELLNKQYEKSITTMMAQLEKRGLNVGGLPRAQTDALERFRNEVMTQKQKVYDAQRAGVQGNLDTLKGNYDLNVTRRMHDIRNRNLEATNSLLTTIADLQSGSYQAYIDYLLAKKSRYSGGGGRSYTPSQSPVPESVDQTPSPTDGVSLEEYFKNNQLDLMPVQKKDRLFHNHMSIKTTK